MCPGGSGPEQPIDIVSIFFYNVFCPKTVGGKNLFYLNFLPR